MSIEDGGSTHALIINNGEVSVCEVSATASKTSTARLKDISLNLLQRVEDSILVLDQERRVVSTNTAFTQLSGYEPNYIVGKSLADLIESGRTSDLAELQHLSSMKEAINIRVKCYGKPPVPCLFSLFDISHISENGHALAVFRDISAYRKADPYTSSINYKDPLTACGNRNLLNFYIENDDFDFSHCTLVFIDIDRFSELNKKYGTDIGDEILIECARRIQRTVRKTDKLVRVNGDQFAVINFAANCDREALGEKLKSALAPAFATSATLLAVDTSISIATGEGNPVAFSELLKRADIAMSSAKQSKSNKVATYKPDMPQDVEYRLFTEFGLRQALNSKALQIHYQPVFSVNHQVLALEALCRWFAPGDTAIPPHKFIPVAEESKDIHRLGLTVFKECCIAKSMLNEQGHTEVKIHVNVSALQLQRPSFTTSLLELLRGFGLKGSDFCLEVPGDAMHNIRLRQVLDSLAEHGIAVAVDNFGAEYTDLSGIRHTEHRQIKFNPTLIPTDKDNKQRVVTRCLIDACHGLDKKIILQGIENTSQHHYAVDNHVYGVQGFLYAKPMHLYDALEFIQQRHDKLVPLHDG